MALADLGDLCHIAGLVEEDADALGVEVIGHGGADRHKDSPRRPAGRPESWPGYKPRRPERRPRAQAIRGPKILMYIRICVI